MCDKKIRQITDRLEAGDSREEITGIINIHKRIRLKFGKTADYLLHLVKLED